MFEGIQMTEPLIWILIAVIFAVIEAFTLGLTTIWFTAGGVAACFIALIGGPLPIQIIVFLLISIILLYFTRPLAEKKLKIGHEKNNIEMLIGMTGLVTEDIHPYQTGLVKLKGQMWTAVSDNQEHIPKGMEIEVVRIEGVKLIVEPRKGEKK